MNRLLIKLKSQNEEEENTRVNKFIELNEGVISVVKFNYGTKKFQNLPPGHYMLKVSLTVKPITPEEELAFFQELEDNRELTEKKWLAFSEKQKKPQPKKRKSKPHGIKNTLLADLDAEFNELPKAQKEDEIKNSSNRSQQPVDIPIS